MLLLAIELSNKMSWSTGIDNLRMLFYSMIVLVSTMLIVAVTVFNPGVVVLLVIVTVGSSLKTLGLNWLQATFPLSITLSSAAKLDTTTFPRLVKSNVLYGACTKLYTFNVICEFEVQLPSAHTFGIVTWLRKFQLGFVVYWVLVTPLRTYSTLFTILLTIT